MVSDRGSHDPEWLELGAPVLPEDQRRRRRRRLGVTAGVVALVLIGWTAARSTDHELSSPSPVPSPTSAASTRAPAPTPIASETPARTPLAGPTVLKGTRPFLPGAGSWELFARGNAAVFRIQLDTGRIVRTDIPPMSLTGSVSFVAGPHDVIATPTDSGPGVLVPDGERARKLPGLLATPGQLFPAPRGHLWYQAALVPDAGNNPTLPPVFLTDFTGKTSTSSIPIGSGYIASDGNDNLLLKDVGGAYEINGSTVHRVTTGSISAVGPHHYLILDCDAAHRCGTFLYDRSTRQQRRIGPAETGGVASGVISPDGTHVVLIHWDRAGPPQFVVLDLRDGTEQQLPGSPDSQLSEVEGNVVWTPDSRYLIAVVDGHLSILDVNTRLTTNPDLPLPPLRQITLRTPTAGND